MTDLIDLVDPAAPALESDIARLGALGDLALRLTEGLPGGLSRIRLSSGDCAVEVDWPSAAAVPITPAVPSAAAVPATHGAPVTDPGPATSPAAPARELTLDAPLVGTFYPCPAPGRPPFVGVGDEVRVGQQVAVIEAMKLMMPMTADRAGRVVQVLVTEGEVVEYGQPLFLLADPDTDRQG